MGDQLHDIETTQRLLGGVGRTTVFELIRTGQLRSVTVGRRRMVPQSQIDRFIAGQLDRRTSSEPVPAA